MAERGVVAAGCGADGARVGREGDAGGVTADRVVPWMESFSRLQTLRGAVASVALSHPEGHDCVVCRAAHGNEGAFARVVAEYYAAAEDGAA